MKRFLVTVAAALALAVTVPASPMPAAASSMDAAANTTLDCSRECMTEIVSQILNSMVAQAPYTLPLASSYRATENSHAAALSMMTLWRTVTAAGDGVPSLLAIDTTTGSAYFALDISEGNVNVTDTQAQSVLWGRVKVVDQQITELELYINRSRGDHGFSFSSEELAANYARWMSPPADRQNATRAELESLSAATFDPNSTFTVTVNDSCLFTEEGWSVVDPGPDSNGSYTPLGCNWPTQRPADTNARTNLVIDEVNGIVVTGAIIPGKVYPYGNVSAFIPNDMISAQEAQDVWLAEKKAEGATLLLVPTNATGETLQVLQYYNGELQGQQIMQYTSGPSMASAWTQ